MYLIVCGYSDIFGDCQKCHYNRHVDNPPSPDLLLQLVDELSDPVPVLLVLLRLELQLLHAPLALGAVLGVVRRHLHRAGQLEVKLQ